MGMSDAWVLPLLPAGAFVLLIALVGSIVLAHDEDGDVEESE